MLKCLQTWLILLVNTVQDFSGIYVCVCIQFFRLHTSSDVWSHILITQIPLTLRTIAVAGPQQCVPEVFLRVPKNITTLTQEASCAWRSSACPSVASCPAPRRHTGCRLW